MHYLVYLIPYSFFEACERTSIGHWIAASTYPFALIETIHIMALAILLGTLLVVDMRLLGIGKRLGTAAELATDLKAWTLGALVVMIVTGVSMFLSEATRMSRSVPFYSKLLLLLFAIAIHFTLHRKVTAGGDTSVFSERLVACISLVCWFGVALAGRGIAFL